MNAARSNAQRLVRDAELLLESGRFPTATSLAALSIEESGKLTILREIALARDDRELIKSWRRYRSHTGKNVMLIFPQLVTEGARRLEDFRSLFDDSSDHPNILDQVKQIGFYTDCMGKQNWSMPSDMVNEELARSLVGVARIMAAGENEISEQEIVLWVKHLKPVWGASMELMREGLLKWDKEMVELGLKSSNGFSEFVTPVIPGENT